jgi:predicted DNA-binding transcriptional regulator YafY
VRTYRVANIVDAAISDEAYPRPKVFDLAAHWEKSARAYEVTTFGAVADIRLSPKGLQRLKNLGGQMADAAGKSAGKPDRNGWVRCSVPIEPGEPGLRELLRLGDESEIIGPAALREQMTVLLAAMSRRYERSAGTR